MWYCIISVCFFPFISCRHQASSHTKNDIIKRPAINKFGEQSFALPEIIPITPGNRPRVVKAGRPVINIDSSNGGIPFFTNYGTEQGLALSSVLCGATDKAGNLWFGTGGGGVSRYDGKSFTNYTVAQGLASNVVFCIIEDKKANLWFGTTAGVSKYNGTNFTNYTTAQGLAGNFVSCIMQDKNENIWFGTHDGGASKFDGKRFTGYTTTQGLADDYVRSMMLDKNGNLWLGTDKGGVSKYDGTSFTNYTTALGLVNNSVNSILQDNNGNLWFGTSAGVSKFNGNSFTNYTTAQGLAENNVSSVMQDKAGNFWFGTQERGVCKYDGTRFTNYTKAQGLPDNTVSDILQDKAGNLWFTSNGGGGVTRYQGNNLSSYTAAQGLTSNFLTCIMQDNAGNLWFGTYNGGVSKFDGNNFTNYSISQGLADMIVWSIMQDKAGNIWFGTDRAGVSKFDGKSFTNYTAAQGLANNTVNNIIQDKNGNIWFGTNGGASKFDGYSFTNYTTAQGLAGNNVQSIIQDKTGDLWFATHDDGVSKYNGNSFTRYTTANGLISNTVYCIMQDKNENIWFGTNEGASRYDGKGFVSYTTAQGLSDNYIWVIVEDQTRNMMWFATNQGLSGLEQKLSSNNSNTQNNEFEIFNKNTGYLIKDVSMGALLVDTKGILWAGSGHNELIRLDYSPASKKNTDALILEIQDVKVNNETICWNNLIRKHRGAKSTDSLTMLNEMMTSFGKTLSQAVLDSMGKKYGDIQLDGVKKFYPVPVNLVLPYKDNNVSFDFVAIEPALPKQVKYQYQLEGYNNDWSPLSNNSTAVFGNISAGTYIFKLKAISPFGVWSETEYTFKVLPPWWFTWWAYTLYGLLAGALLYAFYRNRIRNIEHKQATQINIMVATQEEERKRISRDLHDDIGTKLSALKLFLSSLHEKAIYTNNEEIKSLAESSRQFITEAMQDIRRLLLNLSPAVVEEFGYAVAVEGLINKINETKKIHFNLVMFGMKQRLEKKYEMALYRITQELINNVIKHADAKNVTLQVGLRDDKIILMIEDDGKGFDVNAHKNGYGLQNLHARTNLIRGIMVIDSKAGKGTSVLIEIPYNLNQV